MRRGDAPPAGDGGPRFHLARDGLRLAYWLDRARGDSPPPGAAGGVLLLVHGAASNHTRWSELVEETRLSARWDLLRPDMRGNAASLDRGVLGLDVWTRDLVELLEAEGYAQAVVVGHSLGAQIALRFAHRLPERTRGVALIDPVVPDALQGRAARLARVRPLLAAAAACGRALARLGLHRRRLPLQDLRELDRRTRRALAEEPAAQIAARYASPRLILRHTSLTVYLQQLVATFAEPPPLDEIRRPTLVLRSAGATFADAGAAERTLSRLPRGRRVEIDADHWPLTEAPEETRRALEEWVESAIERPAGDAAADPGRSI